MKTVLFFLLVLCLACAAFAQPDTLWTRLLDATPYPTPRPYAVTVTQGGGIAIGMGVNDSSEYGGIFMLRGNGETEWAREYGFHCFDGAGIQPAALFEQTDGGFMLFGTTCPWALWHGGVTWLRTTAEGDSLDSQTYFYQLFYRNSSVQNVISLANGNYLAICWMSDQLSPPYSYYSTLMEFDSVGNLLWTDSSNVSDVFRFQDAISLESEGFLTVSVSDTNHQLKIEKLNLNLESQWTRVIEGLMPQTVASIHSDVEGGFAIFLQTGESGWPDITTLMKIDDQGNELWSYGLAGPLNTIISVPAGGYAAVRGSALVRLDGWGNIVWSRTITRDSEADEWYSAVAVMPDHSYVLAGMSYVLGSFDTNTLIIRTLPDTTTIAAIEEQRAEIPHSLTLSAYPNPFNPVTTIVFSVPTAGEVRLNVYDVAGRLVSAYPCGATEAGEHRVVFDGSGLSSGIYFVRTETAGFVRTVKVMLMK
jgi:hypothetical protein